MKAIKNKIEHELLLLDAQLLAHPDVELDEETLLLAQRLSKTLYYVEKACGIMHDGAVNHTSEGNPKLY